MGGNEQPTLLYDFELKKSKLILLNFCGNQLMKNVRSENNITCLECGNVITSRADLVVAGKLFQTFHKSCYANPKNFKSKLHKFIGKFPLGLNFFGWLVLINALLAIFYLYETKSWLLVFFIVYCNICFISGRIIIYFAIEKKLQK